MNEPIKTENTDIMSIYQKSENILTDIQNIIETSQRQAYHAVDTILSQRNRLIGYRIAEEELKGENRAEYGAKVIKKLSHELTKLYGKGFTKTNLYNFYSFYRCFPEIFHTLCGKSQRVLSWSHYRVLLQVADSAARSWYEKEAYEQTWSVRTLQRNINTQYYYRMLQSRHKDLVEKEMHEKTSDFQNDKLEFIKNPVIAEFLGLSSNIDLVFYNYILKCFILIDLKTDKITHQDVGQMDMYIRMYDEFKKGADDNPTLGIVLCTETDEDIARYSVLHGNEQLFASKYKLYLPTEEELRKEIEIQKTIFYLRQKEKQSE